MPPTNHTSSSNGSLLISLLMPPKVLNTPLPTMLATTNKAAVRIPMRGLEYDATGSIGSVPTASVKGFTVVKLLAAPAPIVPRVCPS
jgi:hypothetical protein